MELTRICALLARAGINTDHLNDAAVANGGASTDVFEHGVAVLRRLDLTERQRALLFTPDEEHIESDLRWLGKSGATLLAFGSPGYPAMLARIRRAPAALYVLGDPAVLDDPQLAIVGSRKPTPAGRQNAHDFAEAFARVGLTVTSGLALGIDGASHEGALDGGGPTVAVCGNGLDIVYPREHRALAARIRERGALVSEFAPGTEPLGEHFPPAQSHPERPRPRHARRRSGVAQRLAQHRELRARAGPRGVRDPGLHPQSRRARLP